MNNALFFHPDDVVQDLHLRSLGLSLDDIRAIDAVRFSSRSRAYHQARAGLAFRVHPSHPKEPDPQPSESLVAGVAAVLEERRHPRRRQP